MKKEKETCDCCGSVEKVRSYGKDKINLCFECVLNQKREMEEDNEKDN